MDAKTASRLIPSLMIGLLATGAARAASVEWTVSGKIIADNGHPDRLPVHGNIGDPYSLDIAFDTSVAPTTSSGGTSTTAVDYFGSITKFVLTIGVQSFLFDTNSNSIYAADFAHVENDFVNPNTNLYDDSVEFEVRAPHASTYPGYYLGSLRFSSDYPSPGGATNSIDLPTSPLNPASFESAVLQFSQSVQGAGHDDLIGSVESVTAVPLPAAAWLLASGLAGLGVFRRRQQDCLPPK